MDRIRKKVFLATIASLIALEVVSVFLHRLSWARGFTPLGWTAMIRCADILLFFILFRILSVPPSEAGLRKFFKGSITGLAVSLILGSGFFLVLYSIRSFWGVNLRVFVNPGGRVLGVAPLAVLCLIGPFAEEIFFRGLCYSLIRAHRGIWVSVALTSFLFATSHFLSALALGVVLIPLVGGVIFALLYELTGSLFAPFTLHALANFILFSKIF